MPLHHIHLPRRQAPHSPAPAESPAAEKDHSAPSTHYSHHPDSPHYHAPTANTSMTLTPRIRQDAPTTSTPAPSPHPVPSAPSAKDLQRPSAARPTLTTELYEHAPASPSPSHHQPTPANTHPDATTDTPNATPPTKTNTPYQQTPQDPPNQAYTPHYPTPHSPVHPSNDNPRDPPAPRAPHSIASSDAIPANTPV